MVVVILYVLIQHLIVIVSKTKLKFQIESMWRMLEVDQTYPVRESNFYHTPRSMDFISGSWRKIFFKRNRLWIWNQKKEMDAYLQQKKVLIKNQKSLYQMINSTISWASTVMCIYPTIFCIYLFWLRSFQFFCTHLKPN